MEDHFVNAGGINTRYIEEGQGTPLILIHGGGAGADSWGNWKGCFPLLSKNFRVLAIDMVGFGKTDRPDPDTFLYDDNARIKHVVDFIEAMRLERVNLVGNSMGGGASLGVCMKRPELVNKLVLMGSAGLSKTAEMSDELRVILTYKPSRDHMRQLVQALTHDGFEVDEDMVSYRYNITTQPEVMKAYGAMMQWQMEHGGLFYPEEEIRQVKHKTLIVNGKQDKVIPSTHGWKFSQLLDNSWLCLIPNCGHWAMIEHPKEFCDITTWFLTTV